MFLKQHLHAVGVVFSDNDVVAVDGVTDQVRLQQISGGVNGGGFQCKFVHGCGIKGGC